MSSFKTYDEFAKATSSEKITLAHVEGVKRLINFSEESGIWSKQTEFTVVELHNGDQKLIHVESPELVTDSTKWHYSHNTKTVYVFDYNHQESEFIATYRVFFASAPINSTIDLQDGSPVVPYEPRLTGYPNFVSQYAQGKKSISLVGSGTLEIENTDGYFNEYFDTINWENNQIKIYSYHRDLDPSQAKLIFRGYITSKSFTKSSVKFSVKDEIFSLNANVPLGVSASGTTNRWIYGKADNVLLDHLDKFGDSQPLPGSITAEQNSTVIYGENTNFLTLMSENDAIVIVRDQEYTVSEVVSDTVLVIEEPVIATFRNFSEAKYRTTISSSSFNRQLKVCSHKLFEAETTITKVNGRNRYEVSSTYGISEGDFVEIGGEQRQVRRVSFDSNGQKTSIVLASNLSTLPSVGDTVTRAPLNRLRFVNENGKEIHIARNQYSVSNTEDGCVITLNNDAEFNTAPIKLLKQTLTFIPGSRFVWYGSPTIIDLKMVPVNRVIDPITNLTYFDIWNKWFALVNENSERTVFWFSSGNVDGAPQTAIDAAQGGKLVEIPVTKVTTVVGQVLTAEELGYIVLNRLSEANFFSAEQIGDVLRLSSSNITNAVQTAVISGTTVVTGTTPITPNVLTGSTSFVRTQVSTGKVLLNQTTKLSEIVKSRDFIQAAGDGSTSMYEVLSADDDKITLRTPWAEGREESLVSQMNYKNIDYIGDSTNIYIDVVSGKMDENNRIIDSHPKIVRDLARSIGLEDYIDEPSFASAHERARYLPSLCVPLNQGGSEPQAKSIVEVANKSCLGSLHLTDALTLGYDVYDGYVSTNMTQIYEDDCISWSSEGNGDDIVRTTNASYRFLDFDINEVTNSVVTYDSEFARKYAKSTFVQNKDYYLYERDDALETCQRDQFINSMSTTIIKITSDLRFADLPIGSRVVMNLNGFFTPFGAKSAKGRTGIITKKSVSGTRVQLEISDLGAILLRTAKISDEDTPSWQDSTEEQRLNNGYIVDENGIIATEDWMFGTQLIS